MDNDAIRARNIATVRKLYQSERDRDLAGWSALWNSRGRQTFPAWGESATVSGITDLTASTAQKFSTRPVYGIFDELIPFADPKAVFVRLDLLFPGSSLFQIWCIVRFDDEGLIVEIEEMVDTGAAGPAEEGPRE